MLRLLSLSKACRPVRPFNVAVAAEACCAVIEVRIYVCEVCASVLCAAPHREAARVRALVCERSHALPRQNAAGGERPWCTLCAEAAPACAKFGTAWRPFNDAVPLLCAATATDPSLLCTVYQCAARAPDVMKAKDAFLFEQAPHAHKQRG